MATVSELALSSAADLGFGFDLVRWIAASPKDVGMASVSILPVSSAIAASIAERLVVLAALDLRSGFSASGTSTASPTGSLGSRRSGAGCSGALGGRAFEIRAGGSDGSEIGVDGTMSCTALDGAEGFAGVSALGMRISDDRDSAAIASDMAALGAWVLPIGASGVAVIGVLGTRSWTTPACGIGACGTRS
jgi:hypothetical protein